MKGCTRLTVNGQKWYEALWLWYSLCTTWIRGDNDCRHIPIDPAKTQGFRLRVSDSMLKKDEQVLTFWDGPSPLHTSNAETTTVQESWNGLNNVHISWFLWCCLSFDWCAHFCWVYLDLVRIRVILLGSSGNALYYIDHLLACLHRWPTWLKIIGYLFYT